MINRTLSNFKLYHGGGFIDFSRANWARTTHPRAFNMDPGVTEVGQEKLGTHLLLGMTEELGEIAGAIKKLNQPLNQKYFNKTLRKMGSLESYKDQATAIFKFLEEKDLTMEQAKHIDNLFPDNPDRTLYDEVLHFWKTGKRLALISECADLFGYFDLLLTNYNIDIHAASVSKFNKVAEEMGIPDFKIQPKQKPEDNL